MIRAPGTVVAARYEIESRIAAGGMGTVYRARHLVSRRIVALKVVHAHVALEPRYVARFRREASVAAEIGHPGIVQVLDAGVAEDGSLFLAMEMLEGESLRERLCRPETTRGEALALVDAMLDPLAAAHEKGFVHRDLKPENVFVTKDGGVKLLDFGIAKRQSMESATMTGTSIGTPHYMAPEQVMSAKGASPASDVWSVGVMLYEVLAGRPPFTGPTPHAVVVRACAEVHVPVAHLASGVGPELAGVVESALAKDPSRRPPTATVLRERLRAALAADPDSSHEIVTMRPPSPVADEGSGEEATMPMGTPPKPASSERPWRTVEVGPYSIALPPGWSERESAVPGVALVIVEDATAKTAFPTQIRLKHEPFDGDTRAYVDLGATNLARIAHVLRTADCELGGIPAVEIEAQVHAVEPPTRTLQRAMASAGWGHVVQASALVERWSDAAPVLRAILGTLRVRPVTR
jgi:serine/threonine-protein kinase